MGQKVIHNLEVTGFANEGKCIAHHEGKVVFVKGAVPKEIVNVRIVKNKKDWIEAEVTEILRASIDRRIPFCPHFGYCGGCQWQHMDYNSQLLYKQQAVIETLERLGKVRLKTKLPIVGAEAVRYYRNKLEFTFSQREWQTSGDFHLNPEHVKLPALGFHLPGFFDRVFDVKTCFLEDPLNDKIRLAVKKYTTENGYEYFHLKKQTGLMRNLMIRITSIGEVMVVVIFARNEEEKILSLMNFLQEQFPKIASLQYVINNKKNDTIYDLPVITFSGADAIFEKLGDLQLKISAKSFFQTNTKQAEKLYACVKDFAALQGNELVYDLYTGTGSIALSLAHACKYVIGIEQVEQAVTDARENASINNIENVSFQVADISKILSQSFYEIYGVPNVVITDPPRAGMHSDVVKELIQLQPERIVYVSCNVATQARDLQALTEKYSVERIRPFDLFPHTHHIENVAELRRR